MASFTTAGDGIDAPTDLAVATGSASGQLDVSWTAVDGATSYNLYYGTETGVTTATGTKIEDAESPYTQGGLTNGTRYYYIATAVNSGGESVASEEANGVPQINPVGTLDTTFNGVG